MHEGLISLYYTGDITAIGLDLGVIAEIIL